MISSTGVSSAGAVLPGKSQLDTSTGSASSAGALQRVPIAAYAGDDSTTISDADTNDTITQASFSSSYKPVAQRGSAAVAAGGSLKGTASGLARHMTAPTAQAGDLGADSKTAPATGLPSRKRTSNAAALPPRPVASPCHGSAATEPAGTAYPATPQAPAAAQSQAVPRPVAPPASNPEHTVMIFDWDDTILPTSFLARNELKVDGPCAPPAIQLALDTYSQCVKQTLAEARRLGTVFIVTNAETGWIELTVKKFMPMIAKEVGAIRQLSARSAYEPQGIKNPFQWKEKAFKLVIDGHYHRLFANAAAAGHGELINTNTIDRHVISFGDSSHEREAVLRVCAAMTATSAGRQGSGAVRCKSLKFMERPDLEHLTKEHNLIRDCLAQIVSHAGALDLCIQCQQTPPAAPPASAPTNAGAAPTLQ